MPPPTKKRREFRSAAAILAFLVLFVYGVSLTGTFISWDDDFNILMNKAIQQRDYLEIWTKPYYGLYIPLSYTVWTLLAGRAGAWPPSAFPYHLVNLLFHALNAVLVYVLVRRLLTREDEERESMHEPALWGALLFALHPLQVDSVAWISGLRDLLGAAFAFGVMHFHFRRGARDFAASLGLLLLGMFAKPSIVAVLPALLLLDLLALGRSARDSLRRLVPLGLCALPLVWFTKRIQPDAQFTHWVPSLAERPLTALDALGFYAGKFLWPWTLATDYGRTPIWVMENRAWIGTGALALVAAAGAILLAHRFGRAAAAGVWLVPAFLSPVLGFVPFAFQAISTVADHYMYLPLAGLALSLATVLTQIELRRARPFLIVIFALLTLRSFARAFIWRGEGAFYSAWVRDNPRSAKGYLGMGSIEFNGSNLPEAEKWFRRALETDAGNPVALANLGQVLVAMSRFQDALAVLEPALSSAQFQTMNRTRPYHLSGVYISVALAYEGLQRKREAYEAICQAVRLRPSDGALHPKLRELALATGDWRGDQVGPGCLVGFQPERPPWER